jgi:hypothetical protein
MGCKGAPNGFIGYLHPQRTPILAFFEERSRTFYVFWMESIFTPYSSANNASPWEAFLPKR